MATLEKEKFHRAARDGFVDLLKEATRKDCNQTDDDGMTATLWASYSGHLEALRTLVGRGGDGEKADQTGNTALHWAASRGHLNCVSFLVNFGVNIWALNNDYHTAKDLAALEKRSRILDFMDETMAKQSAMNPKLVQKLKEKSLSDADKRVKSIEKLQKKASKKAEKEDKWRQRGRKKMLESSTKESIVPNIPSLKYSDIVSTGTLTSSKIRGFGAVSRKVNLKKNQSDLINIVNKENGQKNLSKSNEVIYVRRQNPNEPKRYDNKPYLKDIFNRASDLEFNKKQEIKNKSLSRTMSEPELLSHLEDSGIGEDGNSAPEASIFERPGFGSVAFRHQVVCPDLLFRNNLVSSTSYDIRHEHKNDHKRGPGSVVGSDSIGSASSLAQRNATMSVISSVQEEWNENEEIEYENENDFQLNDHYEFCYTTALNAVTKLFLAAHNLLEYRRVFEKEKIDLEAIMLLNEDDLKSLNLPLGPRRKLIQAIERRRKILKHNASVIYDTFL